MSTSDDRFEELTAVLLDVARGEFSARMTRSGKRDHADGIAFLVNSMIQEVQRLFLEADRERDFVQTVLKSVPDGVFVVDAQELIQTANPAASTLLGRPLESLVGTRFSTLLANEDHQDPLAAMMQALARHDLPAALEVDFADAHGNPVSVALHGRSVALSGVDDRAAVLIVRDVRERNAVEEQLRQSQKMEAIGTLAAGVAHDMNNILGGVMMTASLLGQKLQSNGGERGEVRQIISCCERGRDLTGNLLGFARKGKYHQETVSVDDVVRQVTALLARTLPRTVVIQTELQPSLPPLWGDVSQLQVALLNVCNNASDAMSGTGTLTLSARIRSFPQDGPPPNSDLRPGSYVCLCVSDTGTGMDATTMERAFDPFYTTKPPGEGTGLGLSMAHGTVKNHDGTITITSHPGTGTTVAIYLPAARLDTSPPLSVQKRAVVPPKKNGTVLLVDDDPGILSVGEPALCHLGFSVLTATHGVHAVQIYRERRTEISLVILDLLMPVMDGSTAFTKLKEIDPDVPVLIASGYSTYEVVSRLLEQGARGFLKKPFDLDELSEAIAKALE